MIDEYQKLHEEFLDLLEKYHNSHIKFITKKNEFSMRPLKKAVHNMGRVILKMKKNNVALAKLLLEEKHEYWELTNSKRRKIKK